jgi:endo-1,4-beta-xylanase
VQGVFNWTEGEIVSSIAKETGQILRCHALVWHSQLAPWVENTTWTPETMRAMITKHVSEVAGHWKGRCYAWDVVNEALNEDGTYRPTIFYQVLGEEYIKLAFKVASEADPGAKLYYNDYNLESVGPKSEAARKIVRMLRAENIKIDGIGMQAHLIAHQAPSLDQQIAVIKSYAEVGVEVAYTELDVRLELPINDTNMAWQKEVYKNVSILTTEGCGHCSSTPQRFNP